MAYLSEQDIPNARRAFTHAGQFSDNDPGVWHGLALCDQLEQRTAEAERLYQRALTLADHLRHDGALRGGDEAFAALLNNHARLMYDSGARYDACNEFRRASSLAVSNHIVQHNNARCEAEATVPPTRGKAAQPMLALDIVRG